MEVCTVLFWENCIGKLYYEFVLILNFHADWIINILGCVKVLLNLSFSMCIVV